MPDFDIVLLRAHGQKALTITAANVAAAKAAAVAAVLAGTTTYDSSGDEGIVAIEATEFSDAAKGALGAARF